MKTRIISGIAMLPLLAIIYLGGYFIVAGALLVGLIGLKEFYKGFEAIDIVPSYIIGVVSTLGLYLIHLLKGGQSLFMFWIFATVIGGLLYLFDTKNRKLEDGLATIVGIFYIVYFSFHIVLIDAQPSRNLIWLSLITAFGTDIFAYFTGMAIGKRKLCPTISPKKSIEGSIGGIVGSVVLSVIFAIVMLKTGGFESWTIIIHCIFIGFVASVISQFGDLTASVFKRRMGIKDYGKLIPGHGGILDRFDSVLFTAPVIYYYIKFFIN